MRQPPSSLSGRGCAIARSLAVAARLAAPLAACAMLAACSLAPPYERPAAPVPPAFPQGAAYLAQETESLPSVSYSDILLDPRLITLIDRALVNNRDLRVAAANIAEARALVRVTRATQFPEIAVTASADTVARRGTTIVTGPTTGNGTGTGDGTGTGTGTDVVTRTSSGGNIQTYALRGGIAGYEIDLFGGLANATRAQANLALATEASAATVRIGLVADIASAWATYAADRDLFAIAQETAANATRSVELTRARLEGGVAPRTDLRQAEQVLYTAQGDLAQQAAALAQDVNLLELLVGAPVGAALLPTGLDAIADEIATMPMGTRSDVLLRRPDVVAAEYTLRSSNADIGVARALLFPSISLSGAVGFLSNAIGSLFDSGTFGVNAGADASQIIFDAGGRRANVTVSQARRDAALADYERTIQTAFREVADALATQGTIIDQLAAAQRNTAAAQDSAALTEARYRGGIDSFLSSLVAQRSLYTARRNSVVIELIALQNRIELYRVLGSDALLAGPAVTDAPMETAQ